MGKTVVSKSIAISQNPAPPVVAAISPDQVTYAAGTKTIAVTSNTTWTAQSNQSWLTLTPVSPNLGNGNANLTCTYTLYTDYSTNREATITLTATDGNTITLPFIQTKAPSLTLSPDPLDFDAAGGISNTLSLTTNGLSWTIKSWPEWMVTPTVTSGVNSSSAQSLTFTTLNGNSTTLAYTGTLVFEGTGSGTYIRTQTVTATQAAPILSAGNNTVSFLPLGGTSSIAITSNTTWTATSSTSWLAVSKTYTSGSYGNGTLNLTCAQNTDLADRTAIITLTPGAGTPITINVTQEVPVVVAASTTASFLLAGGSSTIAITSNTTWTATSSASWFGS